MMDVLMAMLMMSWQRGVRPTSTPTPVGSATAEPKLQKEQMNYSSIPEFCHLFNTFDKEVC
jgi:hypothetical protein